MEEQVKTRVVAVGNNKGGVGKTTTVISLAEAFGRRGCQVLVIDLDPQGNTSFVIGDKHPSQVKVTAAEFLLSDDPRTTLEAIQMDTPIKNVSLIYADIDRMSTMEEEIRQRSLQPAQRLASKLRPLMGSFDVILLDTPPALGMLTANALAASTDYIIPLLAGDQFCLHGLTNFEKLVSRIKEINPDLSLLGALLIQYDNRQSICRAAAATARERYGHVFETTISTATAVKQAVAMRKTVLSHDERNKVSREFRALAKEILARWGLDFTADEADLKAGA